MISIKFEKQPEKQEKKLTEISKLNSTFKMKSISKSQE